LYYFFVFSSDRDVQDESSGDSDDLSDDNDRNSPGHEEWRQTTRYAGPNGHRPIDHRPPEKLLRKAEKKVARYIENKKVTSIRYYSMYTVSHK